MRKLQLDPDQLHVDSFATERLLAGEGTVHAHATPVTMCGATCSPTCATNCDCTYGCFTQVPVRCTIDG
jgi:hypothetical protein